MNIVYLNGKYLPLEEARISPMDRGFLFGDGIYEVIPSYGGRMVGFGAHIERMQWGLVAIGIRLEWGAERWREVCRELMSRNGGGDLGLYLHISRGADARRMHAYPEGVPPTVFGYTFDSGPPPPADRRRARAFTATTAEDLRWRRCDIKSTALLGNVLHYNEGYRSGERNDERGGNGGRNGNQSGNHETLLYNARGEVTEASTSNIFIAKDGAVATPPADRQILPGVTRQQLLDILRADGGMPVAERLVTLRELRDADEVWLSSATKEIAPVTAVDGELVGDGAPGPLWERAQGLFAAHRFDDE